MKNLGIYVQVPFCQTKCTYCNFHTGVVSSARFEPYIEAVCREIQGHRELYRRAGVQFGEELLVAGKWVPERQVYSTQSAQRTQRRVEATEYVVDTVYIGGGTPSLLDARHLQRLMDEIRGTFGIENESAGEGAKAPALESGRYKGLLEVTLEADPETVEEEKAAAWVAAGINRVSFGVQSFVDKELVAAGRMHRRADIYRAAKILREAGIGNMSFDLIAGLPHQTKVSWKESLSELVALAPEHVSVYLLEVDEGSRLGKELLEGGARYSAGAVPGEDEMAEFYEEAQRVLAGAGYHHYEISNWGKPGFESKHNLKYWRREAYLGFGAGAHSFSGKQRWANAHDAAEYVAAMERAEEKNSLALRDSGQAGVPVLPELRMARANAIEQLEAVSEEQALEEELFLGLRQLDGIDVGRIEREYGVELGSKLGRLETAGFVERRGDVVRLAEGKLSVSNEVFVELMK
jgi:oxygen-independent coproporphyrinogen-3 oxidase